MHGALRGTAPACACYTDWAVSTVLVARFQGRSEIAPIVRAAIDVDIVYVALPESPPGGRHTLQLFVGDELVASVSAELVGSGRSGEYPLRVRLLDPAHARELEPLARRSNPPASADGVPSVGPRPSRKSIREEVSGDDEATLASRGSRPGVVEDRTLTSAALTRSRPVELHSEEPQPMAVLDGEVVATTVFDPDSVLRARTLHTGSEDLTIPRTPGSPHPPPPPKRASRRGNDFYTDDDESQTLPGQSTRSPVPGVDPHVSWNVRIAPTTKDPLCGRTIGGGKYVLDSVIGTGAIGIVFKASHRDLGRTIAIKVLNPRYRDDADLLQVFRTEARAASQLEHPNVARVYDYGQEPDGLVYIVMEYLSGYTLGSVLDARRKLTLPRAVDVMVQVCAALTAAHDHNIVHRDVKPDNVVLVPAHDDEGRPVEIVKVCDFGIAALGTARTEEGTAVGTPEYMAPEQTTGLPVMPSADVYACGVVLYEMLVGEVPFTADQAYRIMMKHRNETPRPPSSLDPTISMALEGVILRCMEKSPERRYQSARELRLELRKISPTQSKL
jgi:tRNA A-37 threonylcarbamoyl transferase component Bud32